MSKKKFALIGNNIKHSVSALIHEEMFRLSEFNASYELIDIPINEFEDKIDDIIKSFDGLNITAPYKQKIIKHLDRLDNISEKIGSVNTINITNQKIKEGYNTDLFGFEQSILDNKVEYKEAGILGAGGVARTIAFWLASKGCNINFYIRESSSNSVKVLETDIKKNFNSIKISINKINDKIENLDLLVNATPVGKYPNTNECPILIDKENLNNCKSVFDCIYNPTETMLLSLARKKNIKTINGLQMLIYQAVRAHFLWYNKTFSKEEIEYLYEFARNKLKFY